MNFLEKLDAVAEKNKSLVCIGLDTDPRKLPQHLAASPDPEVAFNHAIIEATSDLVLAYKLNIAFYDGMGRRGYDVLRRTLDAIPAGVVTIGDAKRADIGNTTDHYARALFDDLGFDAITTTPYMGRDSVEPFIRHPDKGIFMLALTSNPGSQDFQYLEAGGMPLYKHVITRVMEWNGHGNCGLVIGATHPEELADVRRMVGDMPILVPGLGAQGGDMERTVRAGATASGGRVLFNNSRAVIYASHGEDFAMAARRATDEMRRAVAGVLDVAGS